MNDITRSGGYEGRLSRRAAAKPPRKEERTMKGLKIVKWEKGAPWPEVIEWRDKGEYSSETYYQKYGWCWRDYLNEMMIFFANDKGNTIRFTKRQLEGSLNDERLA